MDLITLAGVSCIVFILSCILLIFTADSDILTFLAEHFGKNPADILAKKVVWLTGASGGIGEGIAKELAKCEAKMVLSARRLDELDRVKRECLALNPNLTEKDILVLPLDMLDYSVHEPSFKKIIKHFGQLDILISNAGRSQRAHWQDVDIEVDRQLFELNVFSVLNMNRMVLQHFLKIGQGHLAVVSSLAGRLGAPQAGTYSGSKHALQGYFDGLRQELYGKNIDVTLILPGPVHSDISEAAFSDKISTPVNQSEIGSVSTKKMTAERCGRLTIIALANQMEESWMALRPYVAILYFRMYQPFLFSKAAKLLIGRFRRQTEK